MTDEPAAHWWIDAAAGTAPRAVQGLFACWAELNSRARQATHTLDALGGILMADGGDRPAGHVPPVPAGLGHSTREFSDPLYPTPLARLGFRANESPWRSRLGGIQARKIDVWCEPGVDARLFGFEGGAGIPQHDHAGDEFTLVLAGGFYDQAGSYHRGDVSCAERGVVHEPRGLPDEPCICLAVSIGGYRFRNPLIALASSFMK